MRETPGFVYILQNDAMDGVYKIGFTERSPHVRCDELSKAGTAVPRDFSVAYYADTSEPRTLERDTHEALFSFRVDPFSEFFRCPLKMIIETIREQSDDLINEYLSDMAEEALEPGSFAGPCALWFEKSLYSANDLKRLEKQGFDPSLFPLQLPEAN